MSKHTLHQWKARFEAEGPADLAQRKRGRSPGSRLGEAVKRAILLLKNQNPEWGTERMAAMLARGPGFAASSGAVGRVSKEAGHELVEVPTRPRPDRVRRFERASPNQLWQSDLFTSCANGRTSGGTW